MKSRYHRRKCNHCSLRFNWGPDYVKRNGYACTLCRNDDVSKQGVLFEVYLQRVKSK